MRSRAIILAATLAASCSEKGPPPAEPAPQKPDWEAPTPEACEVAIARMRDVMPESLDPDPKVDRADCLTLPKGLVACLGTISSRDDAEACVDKAKESRPAAQAPATP